MSKALLAPAAIPLCGAIPLSRAVDRQLELQLACLLGSSGVCLLLPAGQFRAQGRGAEASR